MEHSPTNTFRFIVDQDPSLLTNQQSLPVPLTNGIYTDVIGTLGRDGPRSGGIGTPIGDCDDLICGSLERLLGMQVLDILSATTII